MESLFKGFYTYLMATLDKEKYFKIYQTQGLTAALTALHHEKESLEQQTFEGPKGYSRELWDYLEEVREFSRELWGLGLKEGYPTQTRNPFIENGPTDPLWNP